MRRRRFLGIAAATGAALSGCTAPPASRAGAGSTAAGSSGSGPDRVESVAGVELPVPSEQLQSEGAAGVIDPVVDPAFAPDWSGVGADAGGNGDAGGPGGANGGPRLTDADPVIGVRRAGEARAYPLRVLGIHEVVNDDLGGPVLVTYCPACASAVVAVRRVRGRETVFRPSGLLWRFNLLLSDDHTGSLWSQLAAAAVRGPATGERLDLVPASLTTWGEWRRAHPGGVVLLPPPASGTAYGSGRRRRYGPRADRPTAFDPGSGSGEGETGDEFTRVIGVAYGGVARAYPRPAVLAAGGLVEDSVGGLPVVVAVGPGGRMAAYDRRLDGAILAFTPGTDPSTVRAGGSRFLTLTGTAIDGPHEGRRLRRATDVPAVFLRAWRDFHAGTDVYAAPNEG